MSPLTAHTMSLGEGTRLVATATTTAGATAGATAGGQVSATYAGRRRCSPCHVRVISVAHVRCKCLRSSV